jgi:Spy/CpxP family protein refolding chaperone
MGMGMMGGFNDPSGIMLIGRKDVQKDLKLTPDQLTKIEAARTAQQEEMRAAMEAMRSGGGGGGFEGMREAFEKMQTANRKKMEEILTKEQVLRLRQINLQIMGGRALMVPEYQKELGLTTEQIDKLQALQQQMMQANQALMERVRSGEMTREEVQSRMQKNGEVFNAEALKILTPEQSAKLETMKGPKFTLDPNEPLQMGGRRGGGRGGN